MSIHHVRVCVMHAGTPYRFLGQVYESHRPEDLMLDVETFYKEHSGIPACPHHEIEIIVPREETLKERPLHIHRSLKNGKPFVCYPEHVKSLHAAHVVFRIWCMGAVLTWEYKIDLNTVYSELCGDNYERFVEVMLKNYAIIISDEAVY